MEKRTDKMNNPKSRIVYKKTTQTCANFLRDPQNISQQTEYALAISDLLAEISAPANVVKAANEKLRSDLGAKYVYDSIKRIVESHSGHKYRTKEIFYDFGAIAEAIRQIGDHCDSKQEPAYRNIDTIKLTGDYISNVLGDEVENILQPYQVSLLDADTGMGKTTFVMYNILKKIKESGKSAILLSNRVCLNRASKKELCKALDVEYQMDIFSEDGINNNFRVIASCVYVISYQQAAAMFFRDLVKKTYENSYDPVNKFGFLEKLPAQCSLIIRDEAHWYTSDASFSAINSFLFDALMKKYPSAAKLFITATMSEDLMDELDVYTGRISEPSIKKLERLSFFNTYGFYTPYVIPSAVHYKISRAEDAVVHNLVEVDTFSNLIPQIVKTAGPTSKWLLFMDNKDEARKLKDEINKQLVSDTDIPTAVFVSAESKESKGVDHDILQQLIEENKFSCPVLLCSSVIDSGLSIKDRNLKYIALPPFAPDTFIQAFGRDRMRNVKKTVYLRRITPKDIGKYLSRAKKVLEIRDAFKNKDWWKINTQYADEFYKSFLILPDGSLEMNRFAVKYSRSSLDFFTEIKEKLEEDRYYYLRLQAQWLNQPESSVQAIIDENEKQFISFMERYRTSYEDGMNKDVFDEFRKEFKENCLKYVMPVAEARADRVWHTDVISRTLEFNGLPYAIEEKRKGAGGKDGMFYYIVKQEDNYNM